MKFGEYFQNVCAEHGASSIRKMSKLTSLGKSSVERIVAGECDIPSDKMVTHVAKITGKSKDCIYHELDYLPVVRATAVNKTVMDIIRYRDSYLSDGRSVHSVVTEWLKENYEYSDELSLYLREEYSKLVLETVLPDYFARKMTCNAAVNIFRHVTCGNIILSTEECFLRNLLKMYLLPEINEYLVICTDDREAHHLEERLLQIPMNTTLRMRILSLEKMNEVSDIWI